MTSPAEIAPRGGVLPAMGTDREMPDISRPTSVTRSALSDVALLRVSGPDAAAFLQGQFTNDVGTLAVDRWQYSAWCSPKGRMLANFVVIRSGDQDYELLLHASLAEAIRKRLAMFLLRSKVTLSGP